MTTLVAGPLRPVSLPEEEADLARESSSALAEFVRAEGVGNGETEPLTLHILNGQTGHGMEARVPAGAVTVLAEVLRQMAQGRPVTLIPIEAELSTQQAADLMGVSRPFFIKLLETGKLPYRKVGEQRRVRFGDLQAYIEGEKKARHTALDELTAEAERLGLYE